MSIPERKRSAEDTRLLKERLAHTKAVIWDMDGVLIDSEHLHEQAHKQALAEVGVKIDRDFYIGHGVSTDPKKFYEKAFKQCEKTLSDEAFTFIRNRKKEIYQKLQANGITPIPQALEVARLMHEQGKMLAVASQVERWEVSGNLQALGIHTLFAKTVASDDFVALKKKPAPDIYLKAAELLGVDPASCVAIEDSANGAAAAVAAGITCLVVPNEYTRSHQFPKEAIVTSFEEIEAALH